VRKEAEAVVYSTEGRALSFNTALIAGKTTRDSQGVIVMTLKPKFKLSYAAFLSDTSIKNKARYTCKNIPAAGAIVRPEDSEEQQLSLE
jgi:hypothetical protein